jgi:hypothetical protein
MSDQGLIYDPDLPVAYANGRIIPVGSGAVSGAELMRSLKNALTMEYQGKDPLKKGLSNADAMSISVVQKAADGDKEAMAMICDRVMGKPVQQVNTVSLQATLTQFLDRVHQQEKPSEVDPF